MKRKLLGLLLVFATSILLNGCGSSSDGQASADAMPNKLVFDLENTIIPAPNDIMWQTPELDAAGRYGLVTFDTNSTEDVATKILYSAINSLNIKGLSPATPIGIPLENSTALNNLSNNIYLIDMTDLTNLVMNVCLNDATCMNTNFTANYNEINENYKLIIEQSANEIKLYPATPLDPGHQYLVVVTDMSDINGNNLLPSDTFELLKSTNAISVPTLETLRQAYLPLWDLLDNFYMLSKEDILELFTFTIADKTLSIENFALINTLASYVEANTMTLSDAIQSIDTQISSSNLSYDNVPFEFVGILNDIFSNTSLSPLFGNCMGVDQVNHTITTFNLATQTTENIPLLVENKMDKNNVIIFQHGYTSQKEAALLFSGYFDNLAGFSQAAFFPVVAIDLPLHGERTPAGETSGQSYITANIPQSRINFIQSIVDQTFLYKYLSSGCIDLDGDEAADTPSNIYYIGHSMGSIIGSMTASYNTNIFKKIILNVGGAHLSALLDTSYDMSDFLNTTLSSMNVSKGKAEYYSFLGLVQLLMDPSDPIYLANTNTNSNLLLQTANKDTFVTNLSNKILSNKLGFATYSPISDFSNDRSIFYPENNWYQFGGDSKTIAHGFLLYLPAFAAQQLSTYTQDDLEASGAALKQIGYFLND